MGDVDGDGDLDIVVAKDKDEPQEVWLNQEAHPTYLPVVIKSG